MVFGSFLHLTAACRRDDGHGFGLHSGANAVKEIGGNLAAHSAGLGHGATFTLDLPVTSIALRSRP